MFGGNTPFFLLPRFKLVFFNVLRTVSWETESTKSNATMVSASSRNVHVLCPSGASLQHSAIKWASSSPVILRRWALVTGLRDNAASKPSSTKRFLSCSTFLVDTSYAEAMSSFVQPHVLSALSKIEALMIVLLLALFFDIISRNAARSVSIKSTVYLMAIAPPSR